MSKHNGASVLKGLTTEKVTMHRCVHCGRRHLRKSSAVDHVRHCFRNPERVPRLGELTSVSQTGRVVAVSGNKQVGWRKTWMPYPEPSWWPGVGKIWDGTTWRAVPGYVPIPAHYSAYAAPDEVWPMADGTRLNLVKPAENRIKILDLYRLRVMSSRPAAAGGLP